VLGGLARRVAVVEKARAQGKAVLVVDSGDLFFDGAGGPDPKRRLTKAQLIAKAYRRMGVTAINVGERDLSHGLGFLRQEASDGLPLVSANLLDASQKTPVFDPFVIKELSEIRVAFFGLISPQLVLNVQKELGNTVVVQEPVEAAKAIVEKLQGKADIIVLLSDLGSTAEKQIARSVPGVHFILGGHEGRFMNFVEQEGETYIVQSYDRGMYLGSLHLTITNPQSPFRDEDARNRIRQDLTRLDVRLGALQATKARQPTPSLDRQIEQLSQQKEKLQADLDAVAQLAAAANRLSWKLEPLGSGLPEAPEVQRWIKDAGIDKD
jgi:2',3'-cyclic-nucleotide 2'-phosphodiesterase (5'-nucleotidase family)